MLSLHQLRKIDPILKDLPDEEVLRMREQLYELGELIFEDWQRSRKCPKSPVGVLTVAEEKHRV